MTKQNFFTTLLLFIAVATFATGGKTSAKISVKDYIRKWAPVAQKHMKEYRIPASIILAQGILESGYGNSSMAQNANNHFGIKCLGWKGAAYYQRNAEKQCYRKYLTTEECFRDHARILTSKSRYSFLFKLSGTDYKSWAKGLKKAGYAMDPAYDQLLIKTIEEHRLYAIDKEVVGHKKPTKQELAEAALLNNNSKNTQPETEIMEFDSMMPMSGFVPEASKPEILSFQIQETEPITEEMTTLEWMPTVNLRHIIAGEDISMSQLAEELEVPLQILLEYNDLTEDHIMLAGERIYLEEKQKSCTYSVCTAHENQTLWDVAQLYGLKLRRLEQLNKLKHGQLPESGAVLRLK